MSLVAFAILAGLILAGALVVVFSSNIVRAAVALAFTFFLIAGLYFMLGSPMLAVVQFAVNAAAIPILTLFIIMMTRSRSVRPASGIFVLVALAVVIAFAGGLWAYLGGAETQVFPVSPEGIGLRLLSVTLLPFEVASVLLLLAMVGAIVLARRVEE